MDVARMPAHQIVPHEPPMVLIDRVLSHDDKAGTVARIAITADSLFAEADGVPGWIGIEYMAQCVAAHGGCKARLRGESPPIGFLIGVRKYECSVPAFALGKLLTARAVPLFDEGGLSAFFCTLESDGVIATATVNAYILGGLSND